MPDYLRTALLIEEKAARLSRDDPRRGVLLAVAGAARLIGFEQRTCDFEVQQRIGSFRSRAYVLFKAAGELPDGPDQQRVALKAWRVAIHAALDLPRAHW